MSPRKDREPRPYGARAVWAAAAAVLLVPAGLAVACSGQTQGGLVNAPASNRVWTADDRGHDAIANGPESCPPSGKTKDDPIPKRVPKCPEAAASAGAQPAQSKSPPK